MPAESDEEESEGSDFSEYDDSEDEEEDDEDDEPDPRTAEEIARDQHIEQLPHRRALHMGEQPRAHSILELESHRVHAARRGLGELHEGERIAHRWRGEHWRRDGRGALVAAAARLHPARRR